MASAIEFSKVDQPELVDHQSSILDLAFIMDCTGSMSSYIASALENIRSIVQEIVISEKSDMRLALIEYRDHPPQDTTFVTRVHDFTPRVNEMKGWLEQCQAAGGGDGPEAVADGLQAALKLSWRPDATKISILISDAPPHGLQPSGDGFPNGCPCGIDPLRMVRDMVEYGITLYVVGVEPSIVPYRDFFMALAYTTGGQYVPMVNAKLLAKVVIGGVREEITLERLMKDAQADIEREMQRAETEGVGDDEKRSRIHRVLEGKKGKSKRVDNIFSKPSTQAKAFSDHHVTMESARAMFASEAAKGASAMPTAAATAAVASSSYDMVEEECVTEEQAERIYKKVAARKK